MFSYFLKASVLAVIISGGACHADKAWFGKNAYTCPDLTGGLKHKCDPDWTPGFDVCDKAATWITQTCKTDKVPGFNSGPAYFPDTTCAAVATEVFNKIGSPNGDTKYQNIGYDFIIQNCEDK